LENVGNYKAEFLGDIGNMNTQNALGIRKYGKCIKF
jgi:hypothetical protein